jgi:hypothetical protein
VEEFEMGKDGQVEKQTSMRKFIFYATIASGCVAAYLMYRRGESLGTIATRTITNPIGSLVTEVKSAV